jgi:hypothetical protein
LAGALILDRNNDNESILFTDPFGEGDPVAEAELDLQTGIAINVIRHRDTRFDWEFGIMALGTGDQLNLDPGVGFVPTTPPILAGGLTISDYRSDFWSMEFNLRSRRSDRLALLAGMRYINLNEDLLYLTAPLGTLAGLTTVNNNLFGGQVGVDAKILQGARWDLNGVAKAGLYYNDVEHDTTLVSLGGLATISDDDDPLAFQAETQLSATWWIGEHFGIRFGYQLMWLDGVATAPGQFPAMDLLAGTGIDTSSSPFWHGAIVQAEVTW